MTEVQANTRVVYIDDERVDHPGYYLMVGDPETDANGVEHHTNLKIGDEVFPGSDGNGFVTTLPEKEGE